MPYRSRPMGSLAKSHKASDISIHLLRKRSPHHNNNNNSNSNNNNSSSKLIITKSRQNATPETTNNHKRLPNQSNNSINNSRMRAVQCWVVASATITKSLTARARAGPRSSIAPTPSSNPQQKSLLNSSNSLASKMKNLANNRRRSRRAAPLINFSTRKATTTYFKCSKRQTIMEITITAAF